MDRKLMDYLPDHLREIWEFQLIFETQEEELSQLWNAYHVLLADQFVDTATERGLERWEDMLNIRPKGSDTLETRRFIVRSRLNEQLPFSIRVLKNTLTQLCGEGGYTLSMDYAQYTLRLELLGLSLDIYRAVMEVVWRMVPANLVLDAVMAHYNDTAIYVGCGVSEYKQEVI